MKKGEWRSLLTPDVLNSVKGLELIARVLVEGYMTGLHTSRKTGVGLEFSQYRGYEPGDDLRLLDWKMFARSGRYYIKQSDVETNVIMKVVMDSSHSMSYEEGGLSKWELSRVLGASLAYLATRQQDDIGLFVLNDKGATTLNAREDRKQLERFLQRLIEVNTSGRWPESANLDVLHSRSKKEIIVFISDFLQHKKELLDTVRNLKTSSNEVMALYLVGRKEESLDFKGNLVFEDLETAERREVNTTKVRDSYIKALKEDRELIRRELQQKGITWMPFYLDENPGELLRMYLKQRNRLIR